MEKQRWEEPDKRREEKRRREKIREEKGSEERRCRWRDKVEKSRFTVFFQWFVAPEGSKSRLAKAAGCGVIWGDERRKIARRCGAKQICN